MCIYDTEREKVRQRERIIGRAGGRERDKDEEKNRERIKLCRISHIDNPWSSFNICIPSRLFAIHPERR